MTLTTLTNAINGLLGFRGQRIGFPDGRYYNECTAVVAHLHSRLGIPLPGMFGARADGWGVSFPGELAPYYSHEAYQPGKAYPYGTLLLWNSPHIAIVLSHDGGNLVQVFQQNADPNGAPCEVFNRVVNNQFHTCTYALVPKLEQPPQEPLYRVDPIPPKQIQVKPGSRKWNLAQPSFESVANNPITTAGDSEAFTATAILHHREIPQYNYYLEDANTPHGWNVLDCMDYVAPPPPAPTPPAAPATFPSAYTPYWVRATIKWYPTALSARNDMNARGTIGKGNYLTYRADGDMLCLVREKSGEQYWINPGDNVEPVPEPMPEPAVVPAAVVVTPAPEAPTISEEPVTVGTSWKVTHSMRGDGKPVWFVSTNTEVIKLIDLEGKSDIEINLHPGTELGIVQWFTKDGIKYYRDTKLRDHFWYFSLKADYLVEMPQIAFDANQDGKVTFEDVPALMQGFIDYGSSRIRNTARIVQDLGLPDKFSATSKKARQVIDGFSKGKKKDKVQ